MKIEQAVIFAGGQGDRLRPLTDNIPKPMAPVCGRPFLDYLLFSLVDAGIKRILVLVGYKADVIMNHYGDGADYDFSIDYSVGKTEDLTGRRLLNAYDKLEDHFLLLYGDNYWPVPLKDMVANYERLGVPVTTTVFRNKDGTGEYGIENNVSVTDKGMVKAYDKSRSSKNLNGVDIGYFMVDKKILNSKELGNISFEEKIMARLVDQSSVGAFMTDEQYHYITSLESLARFEGVVRKQKYPKLEKKVVL